MTDLTESSLNDGEAAALDQTRRAPAFYNDLAASLAEGWTLLEQGVHRRSSPFHTPAIGTIGVDGAPTIRTMVLRAVDRERREVRVHSDRRSAKLSEIQYNPRIALHAYDPALKVQLRLRGIARVDEFGPEAGLAWQRSRKMSRACYRAPLSPGTAVLEPDMAAIPNGAEAVVDAGRDNFCAIMCTISELEWLYLAATGHRRARFAWSNDGTLMTATWLAP